MKQRRLRRRWLAPAALLPFVLLTCGPSANADSELTPPWPGLPTQVLPTGSSGGAWPGDWADGLSEVARAKQWVQIPAQAVAAAEVFTPATDYPVGDPKDRRDDQVTLASVYLSSPKGAQYGYGIGLPITVRTVAFGSIPIQVGVQLEQLRDAKNLPVPLQIAGTNTTYRDPQQVARGVSSQDNTIVKLTGQVRVRLTDLSVDGVDVGLQNCASAPISLDLHADTVWWGTGTGEAAIFDQAAGSFAQPPAAGTAAWSNWLSARSLATLNGGAVTGDIDIPAFSGCLTKTGDDLSPLLTSTVSGPGNPVTVGFAAIGGNIPNDSRCGTPIPGTTIMGARGPFLGDPADCDPAYGPPTLGLPKRTN